MKSSLMLFRSVFFSRFQSVTLIVFLLWATQILGSDSLQTRNNAPVVQSNLAVRLNTFLTRTEEIRIVLLRIANEANNEGVQGADKIYEAVLEHAIGGGKDQRPRIAVCGHDGSRNARAPFSHPLKCPISGCE